MIRVPPPPILVELGQVLNDTFLPVREQVLQIDP